MRLLRTLSVVVALGCADGNTTRAQEPPSAEALRAARELAAVMSVSTIGDLVAKLTEQAWPDLEAELRQQFPAIDDAALAVLRQDFERLQFVAIVDGLDETAAVYARHLSVDEMRAMIAFYRTPAGAKALAVLSRMSAESMDALAPRIKATQQRFIAALAETPQETQAETIADVVRQLIDAEGRQEDAARLIAKLLAQAVASQEAVERRAAAAKAAAERVRMKEILLEASRRRRIAVAQFAAQLQAAREQLKAKAAAAEAAKAEAVAKAEAAKAEAAAKKTAPPPLGTPSDPKAGQKEKSATTPRAVPLPKIAAPPPIIIGKKTVGVRHAKVWPRVNLRHHQRWSSQRTGMGMQKWRRKR